MDRGQEMEPSEDGQDPQTESEEPLYVISVAAKLVKMPTWTLRVLDEQGIVVPRRTDKNRMPPTASSSPLVARRGP